VAEKSNLTTAEMLEKQLKWWKTSRKLRQLEDLVVDITNCGQQNVCNK
jgi:hypothetical protein